MKQHYRILIEAAQQRNRERLEQSKLFVNRLLDNEFDDKDNDKEGDYGQAICNYR